MATFHGHQEPEVSEENLQNDAFYPAISTHDFLQKNRNEVELQAGEVSNLLQRAVHHVNQQLYNYKLEQAEASLAEIPQGGAYGINPAQRVSHYQNAVYCTAKALMLANYRDASTTGKGHEIADELSTRKDEYQAQSWREIRSIIGKPRLDVALI